MKFAEALRGVLCVGDRAIAGLVTECATGPWEVREQEGTSRRRGFERRKAQAFHRAEEDEAAR